jgi:hypothetical protein
LVAPGFSPGISSCPRPFRCRNAPTQAEPASKGPAMNAGFTGCASRSALPVDRRSSQSSFRPALPWGH